MSFYPSIKFTQKHHDEIAQLYDYSNLDEAQQEKALNNLKNNIDYNEAPRFLYIIRSGQSKYYKIGVTNNLEARLKTLQTGNPEVLNLIAYFVADLSDLLGREIVYIEKFLHKNYKNNNVQGEWFKLTYKEIADICFFMENDRELEFPNNYDKDIKELSVYRSRVSKILRQERISD